MGDQHAELMAGMKECNRLFNAAVEAQQTYHADPTIENRVAFHEASRAHSLKLNELKAAVEEAKALERQQRKDDTKNNELRNGISDTFSSAESSTDRLPRRPRRITAVERDAPGHD